jgi:iron complex outermembrane receptor protein
MKATRLSRYALALTLPLGAIPTPLVAEEKASRRTLEEVLVVAQKREERKQDVPISMNVMSDVQLTEQNITTVTDLARIEPSLNFQQGFAAHSNNYAMRGITSYSLEGGIQPSVSLVVDGVPLFRAGEFASELADIARVEVLKGPQGTFFGKNSTGGAINLVRKRPTEEFEAKVSVSFTGDDEKMTSGVISGQLMENVNGRLAAFYKTRDGHIKNEFENNQNDGGEESWGVVAKLDFPFSETTNLLVTGEYRLAESGLGPQITVINTVPEKDAIISQDIFDDPFKTKTNTETANDVENWALTAEFKHDLSDTLSVSSITGYRKYHAQTLSDIDASPASGTNPQDVPVVHIPVSNLNRYPSKLPHRGQHC